MAFSGHETFHIREGWLHKGLKLLVEEPGLLIDDYSHDWLGVGKNMARSIKHWLAATGIAHRESARKNTQLAPTALGELIWARDPYFMETGTLWALHVNLAQPGSLAGSWSWFFNHFNLSRFEKAVCVETLRRHLDMASAKVPSATTLDRDLSCLLSFYARPIPAEEVDREEAIECPFRELGLLSHFRASGYYQLNPGPRAVPPELLGYALAKAYGEDGETFAGGPIPVTEAARKPGGPARAFALTAEGLFELASSAEAELGEEDVRISGLAGSRTIQVRERTPIAWLEAYYDRLEGDGEIGGAMERGVAMHTG